MQMSEEKKMNAHYNRSDGVEICHGDLATFSSILSPAFRASTVFSGLSVLITALSLLSWITVCFISSAGLFKFSGILQIISGIFMLIVLLSYPAGWDNFNVINVCGPLVGYYDNIWSSYDCFIPRLMTTCLGHVTLDGATCWQSLAAVMPSSWASLLLLLDISRSSSRTRMKTPRHQDTSSTTWDRRRSRPSHCLSALRDSQPGSQGTHSTLKTIFFCDNKL